MDTNYQQAMIQALMGQQQAPGGTANQNPTTPYGQGFMTGNMMNPNTPNAYGMQNQTTNPSQQAMNLNSANSLSNGPSTQLMQPFSTY